MQQQAQARSFYHGWIMLPIATLALIATSPGQTFSIAAFNESLRTALNLTHSQLTGAYMLGTLLASFPMAWVGALMDRHGQRRTMTVIVFLLGAVCIATSQTSGLITLFFAFLMLRMLGPGALGLLSGNTLPFWFQRRLGTLEGLRMVGLAGAIMGAPMLNLWLIQTYGWRTAWIVLGLIVWGVMLPAMLLFRNSPAEIGQQIDGHPPDTPLPRDKRRAIVVGVTFTQARRTRAFWIVCTVTAMWSMLTTAVLFNAIPLFQDRGMTEHDAKWLFTGYAISWAVMQVLGGILSDRIPLHYLLTLGVAGMALCMGLFWQMNGLATAIAAAVMMGISQGLLTATNGPLWPRYYGTAHIGRIRGTLATAMVSASSAGPFLLGICVDLTGSYNIALMLFTLLPLLMLIPALFATPPSWPAPLDTGMHGPTPDADALSMSEPGEAQR